MSTPTNLIDFLVNQANGVKGLADLNLPSVPPQYIQPLQARLDKSKIVPQESIPIIDFTNWDDPDVQDSIFSAATKWRFFQIVNHGIPIKVFDNLKAAVHRFFELPAEEKKYLKQNSPPEVVRLANSFSPHAESVLEWKDYLQLVYTSEEKITHIGRLYAMEEFFDQEEEEARLWSSMVEEASRMEMGLRGGEGLDQDTMNRFVSPVIAKIESDEDYAEYLRTELVYQTGLSQEPNNALLLANYAQFLYLVAHDIERAEEYFKRAIEVEPPDAEAYNKYATFLWKVKNDLWAAEETYLEAISAEPTNSYYAANYAHFLWNTGGEDTCFPLSSPDTSQEA